MGRDTRPGEAGAGGTTGIERVVQIPIHLDEYDPIAALVGWKKGSSEYAAHRTWSIGSYGGSLFQCPLSWIMKPNGQVAGLDRYALPIAEAVWAVLEEFTRLEALYNERRTS